MHASRGRAWLLALPVAVAACSAHGKNEAKTPLVVFTAGSLTRPLKAALDSFSVATNTTYQMETAGSLETARKLTELGKVPDVLALADVEVFPQLLMPTHVSWFATFATNRIVLAKGPKAQFAAEINASNWWTILQRPGLEVGRADPDVDPAGYRTLFVFQLAERDVGQPGLAKALEAASPRRNMRPKSAELTAMLQAGELDYAWEYESVARAAKLEFVTLSPRVDLGSTADSATYATAAARVLGAHVGDTVTIHGAPVRYGLAIPLKAKNTELAAQFVSFLTSPAGKAILRREYLPVLDTLLWTGSNIPAALSGDRH
ncbi:MAG: extracellular solute-binding protein [Gemmatimonadaceae bacterium]